MISNFTKSIEITALGIFIEAWYEKIVTVQEWTIFSIHKKKKLIYPEFLLFKIVSPRRLWKFELIFELLAHLEKTPLSEGVVTLVLMCRNLPTPQSKAQVLQPKSWLLLMLRVF